MATESKSIRAALTQPSFVASALIVGVVAASAGPAASLFDLSLRKGPVDLQKPLSQFDKSALGPYRFASASTIQSAVLAVMGCQDYIDWHFEDTRIDDVYDPLRYVRLFISYNTGNPSQKVHVPDNCLVGNGYKIKKAGNSSTVIETTDGKSLEVPIRAVTFTKSELFKREEPTAVYTFHCNGRFLNTQQQVNTALINPLDKSSYFCKIEVTLLQPNPQIPNPSREATIAATEDFLGWVLPVLLRDHLVDWEALKEQEKLEPNAA